MEALNFAQAHWLWLLPLALLPLWRWQRHGHAYPALTLVPADPLSNWLHGLIRLLAALLIASLLVAMAEPYEGEETVEKMGTGAHIVILLDRSSSMNDDFLRHSPLYTGSKNEVARKVLNQIIDGGNNDFYGLVSFSTSALYMLPLSQQLEVIRAGVNSTLNRGRGSTAIEKGLDLAMTYFEEQPRSGSRLILLVSDGGGMITIKQQAALRQRFRDQQVGISWLYLKGTHGNKLVKLANEPERSTNPEYFLHQYFETLNVPYHAYEIEEPGALKNAITEISALRDQPLRYQETLPRRDLAQYVYYLSIVLLLLLLPARWLEADSW